MKIKQIIYLLLCLSLEIFSQSDSSKIIFRISSVSISGGILTNQSPVITQEDYKKIAPKNTLVNANLNGYKMGLNSLNGNGYFNFNVGFKKLNKKDYVYSSHIEYRIGFRYLNETLLSSSYSYDSLTIYDTLRIGATLRHNVTIDTTKYYSYSVLNNTFIFDLGFIYQSDPRHLLTAYIGGNLGLGSTFSSDADAYYRSSVITKSSTSYDNKDFGIISELTPLRNSFVINGSLVWGGNFRLARTKKFWSRTCINIEGRFGVTSQNIQNYGTYTRMVLGAHFGFKFLL